MADANLPVYDEPISGKRERDRLRAASGQNRKIQLKSIRKVAESWLGGSDAGACLARIGDILRDAGSAAESHRSPSCVDFLRATANREVTP